jgi:hypothetical protein
VWALNIDVMCLEAGLKDDRTREHNARVALAEMLTGGAR